MTAATYTILAGSYTNHINTFSFDASSSSITLVSQSRTGTAANPSWIAQSATNPGVLFATKEVASGSVESFSIDDKGGLEVVSETSSGGDDPAHILPLKNGKEIIVTNYTNATTQSIVLKEDGVTIDVDHQGNVLQFVGSGPNKDRQECAHAHEAVEFNEEVLVPDLGCDKVWRLGRIPGAAVGQWQINGFIPQEPGSGPRHARVVGSTLYTLQELTNVITAQDIPPTPSSSLTDPSPLAKVSTLPADVPSGATYTAAELLVDPSSRFLFASNRNISSDPSLLDPRGDSIAILALGEEPSGLRLVKQVFTGLGQIRGMSVSKDGRYLVASGLVSGGVKVYELVDGGSDLKEVASYTGEGSTKQSTFVWL